MGLLMATFVRPESTGILPAALLTSTVQAAGRALAGRAALAAAVSLSVSALTEATLRTLLMTRITLAAALLATAAAAVSLTIPFIRPTLGAGSRVAFTGERLQPPDPVVNQDATARRDLDLLQGTWYRVSSKVEGKKVSLPLPPKDPALMIVFKGDGWYGIDKDRKTLVQGHVVRLSTMRQPKAIDLYDLGPNRNPLGRAWIQGIYNLDGDILTLCLSFGGADRILPNSQPRLVRIRPGSTSIGVIVLPSNTRSVLAISKILSTRSSSATASSMIPDGRS